MTLIDLIVPILVSAVAVWFASFIAWALSPHHRGDYQPLDESADETIRTAVKGGIKPGQYLFPFPFDPERMKDDESKAAMTKGHAGLMRVFPPVSMGRNMALTMVTFIVVSLVIGYMASFSLARCAAFMDVFRFAGTAGVLAYTFAFLPNGIWFGMPMRAMVTNMIDGIIFGVITGLVFAALWPGLVAAV